MKSQANVTAFRRRPFDARVVRQLIRLQDSDLAREDRALGRIAAWLTAAIEHSLDAVSIYCAVRDYRGDIVDFRLEYMNAAARGSDGLARDGELGRCLTEFLPDHVSGLMIAELRQVAESGRPVVKEGYVVNATLSPVLDQAGRVVGVLLTERDITRERAREARLEQALWRERQRRADTASR